MTDKEKSQIAKSYLSQISHADSLIVQLQDSVKSLRASLTSQGYSLQPDKVQTSGPKDQLSATIEKIVDYEVDIDRRVDELIDLKRTVTSLIEQIPNSEQQAILIGRYVSEKPWSQLALEMNYGLQNLYKIHGKALLKFFEYLPKE